MLRKLTITFMTLVSILTVYSSPTHAVSIIAESPCDSLYYESLSARAWLEAQREITQNQNIILKPDSVMEYTCFDRMVHELANHGTNMLSETTVFGNALPADSLDNALDNLVLNSLEAYMIANHGGRTGAVGYDLLGGHPAAMGIAHQVRTIGGNPEAYSCDIMERVWQAAKCMNFITDPTSDGFYNFNEYMNPVDRRRYPVQCTEISTNWIANVTAGLTTGPWTTDPVETFLSELAAPDCGASGNCRCQVNNGGTLVNSEPIPTGLTVTRPGLDPFPEKVCLQPGCRYNPPGGTVNGSTGVDEGCYGR